MIEDKASMTYSPGDIWIISEDSGSDTDLYGTYKKPVKSYRISAVAQYMLDTHPITIKKKLIGCEITYRQTSSYKRKSKLGKLLPKKLQALIKNKPIPPEEIMVTDETIMPHFKDAILEAHFDNICEQLRHYDPVVKKVLKLDYSKIDNVRGICKHIDNLRLWLDLQGTVSEKARYIADVIDKEVPVVIARMVSTDGCFNFNMEGYDFKSYNPQHSYRMACNKGDGSSEFNVLNTNGTVAYKFTDMQNLQYMFLLQQCVQQSPELAEPFYLCIRGRAKPLTVVFNEKLKIDYSKTQFPAFFREIFRYCNVELSERDTVVDSLNRMQFGIAFKYILENSPGENKIHTAISVLHDLKALEPLKKTLPKVYSEIHKRTFLSNSSRFYLLDSMTGCSNGN